MTVWLFVLLLGLLAALLLVNAPIAVAIGAASMITFLASDAAGPMLAVQRMFAGADSFPLMAVPLFMAAGLIMQAGGISQRIVALAEALVGWLPGGLAAVAIVSAMFFAGISGSAAADTAAVGGILIPAMTRHGYRPSFAAAVQASGGSIGVIIPPSIPMIIFGVLTGASIGKLFAAGILPGLLMGVSLIAVSVVVARRQGLARLGSFSGRAALRRLREAVFALGAPVLILGGILGGVFTATESAAVAVFYGLVVGLLVYRELKPADLPRLFREAAVMASVIMFIIASASAFSWLLAIGEAPKAVAAALLSLSSHPVVLLLLINLMLLVVGTVVETTAALILFVPVLLPVLPGLGIDLVHFGVVVVMNLAIGMLTPPLGVCLIVSSSIAGERLERVSRRVLPFLVVLLADLALILFWEPLTSLLPGLMD